MPVLDNAVIIAQTKKWLADIVIGCNFCPFAARELKRDSISFQVLPEADKKTVLEAVARAFVQLDNDATVATLLLILPQNFDSFYTYLDIIDLSERLLKKEKKEGIYQLASFHPSYLFAGTKATDPENYTNRSPYPMIHFLRENMVSLAADNYPGVDEIPEKNIAFANEKGAGFFKSLLADCLNTPSEEP